MLRLKYWPEQEDRPLSITTDDLYQWTPPTVLPNRTEQFNAFLATGAYPAWTYEEWVTPAPLKLEEYPWEKPLVLPQQSDSFDVLIPQFTYAPDSQEKIPVANFGGMAEGAEWTPPTLLPQALLVQNPFSYGDGDDSPQGLTIEDYPWDAMPMRLASKILAPVFSTFEELPNFILVNHDYEWWVKPPVVPFAPQPFGDTDVFAGAPLHAEDADDPTAWLAKPGTWQVPASALGYVLFSDDVSMLSIAPTPGVPEKSRRRSIAALYILKLIH